MIEKLLQQKERALTRGGTPMSSIRRFTIPALVLLTAVGTGVAAPAVAKDHDRSFTASLTGTASEVEAERVWVEKNCREIIEIVPAEAVGEVSVITMQGTGKVGRLGRVQFEATYCADARSGAYGDGVFTLTAANGDVLAGRFFEGTSDLVDSDVIAYRDTFEFVPASTSDPVDSDETADSTGRFAAATGSGREGGWLDLSTGRWTLEMEGTIAHSRR